jgi:hypothetical protein
VFEQASLRWSARSRSFFVLGGNSLLAVRMQAQLRDTLGLRFPMAAFYRSPTIAMHLFADGDRAAGQYHRR